ncbi:hypothetical protein Trydic_g18653 [Trypoxylus dichotomus]
MRATDVYRDFSAVLYPALPALNRTNKMNDNSKTIGSKASQSRIDNHKNVTSVIYDKWIVPGTRLSSFREAKKSQRYAELPR